MKTIWGTYLFEGKERQAHTRNKLLAQRSRYACVDKGIAVACVTFFGLTTVVDKIATILYSRCSEKIFCRSLSQLRKARWHGCITGSSMFLYGDGVYLSAKG